MPVRLFHGAAVVFRTGGMRSFLIVAVVSICSLTTKAGEALEPARAFLQVPDHYVGNISKTDRRRWLKDSDLPRDPWQVIEGRNLHFSYDGEESLGGEGPFTLHVFTSPKSHRTIGIFIERFYDASTRTPPSTSLYILSGDHWTDVTRQVLPQPFDPRLYYEFSPSADTITVRTYGRSREGYITPGRVLERWQWSGSRFTVAR
jgi:hypothetical protein